MGNMKPQVKQYEPSGMLGCLQMFLPPYTSTDPGVRAQQTVVLLGFTSELHYYYYYYYCYCYCYYYYFYYYY